MNRKPFAGTLRRVLTATAAVALGAGLLALPAQADTPTSANSSPAVGWSLNMGASATGRHIGTWNLPYSGCGKGNCATVMLDAGKKESALYSLNKIYSTSDLGGAYANPSARTTARISYLMSRYGTTTSATTAAALDEAVLTLMNPHGYWALGHKYGKKRVAATHRADAVTKAARAMLRYSYDQSGPYTLQLSASGQGDGLTVKFRGLTLAGKPLANRAVDLSIVPTGGGTPTVFTVTTDSSGRATLAVAGQTPGSKDVTATVKSLLPWRLYVAPPKTAGASRLAVASDRVTVTKTITAGVKGDQVLTLTTPSPKVPANFAGSVKVDGWGGDRAMTSELYGPFATSDAAKTAACGGTPVYTATSTVNADGTYPLATGASSVGWWTYKVAIAGNAGNNPAAVCSTPFSAKAAATVTLDRGAWSVKKGSAAGAKVTVSGLPDNSPRTVTVKLYGAYSTTDAVACTNSKVVRTVALKTTGNGTYTVAGKAINTVGYYGWYASLPGGDTWTADATSCPPAGGQKIHVS